MPDSVAAHPDRELLAAYVRGTLPSPDAAAVEAHIEACPACAARLDEPHADPFLSALRAARLNAASGGPIDAPTVVFLDDASTVRDEIAVPEELAAHPRYRLGALLGRGGMGAVYKAEHTLMERPVAVKVIAAHLLRQPGAADRFRQEVKAAARLSHPNIVTAFDAEQVGPVTVLVMEYVEGRSLADVVRAGGPLLPQDACGYARQAALGLAHAHALGMVHRDVKPHNLMLTPDGRVKILDFGLARFVAEGLADAPAETVVALAAGDALTHTGACMGTLDYMAPEQARDARTADARADVYALGCTLYHLLTGVVPFPGGSNLDKLARLGSDEPTPLAELCPAVPPQLAAVVAKMMAKRPDERFASATEVADALVPFTLTGRVTPRRRRNVFAALAAVLICAATAAAVVKVTTARGEVTIETDDPDVEVVVKGDRIVRVRDPKSGREYTLDRTDLTFGEDGDGVQVTLDGTKPVVLKRSGKAFATVRLVPKPAEPWVEIFRTAWAGTGHVNSLTFSPDGKDLLVGRGDDGFGRIYDLATGKVRLEQHGLWIGTYRPDGKELLSDVVGNIWANDARTGKQLRKVASDFGGVGALYLAPDGATVILSTPGVVFSLWDVASGKKLNEWEKGRGAYFSPVRGEILLARDINAPDAVWDIATGVERPAPKEYSRLVGLALGSSEWFGPDRIATWVGQTLSVYNRADGKLLHTVDMGAAMDRRKYRNLGIGPGGRFVVHTGEDTTTAVVREVATGKELARLNLGRGVAYQCAASADGKRVAVANQFGEVAVWELSTPADTPKR